MLKHDTLAQRAPTLDRATYGNVSMTRLVSSPVCPALWPFIIRAAVTVGIPIPGSMRKHSRASDTRHSVNVVLCGTQRQVSNINGNAEFLFEAGLWFLQLADRPVFQRLQRPVHGWEIFFFWLIFFYGYADESAEQVLAKSDAKQHLHKLSALHQ